MTRVPSAATPAQRAIGHVTRYADGGPVDPTWRITVHFHPDRLTAGVPILRAMAGDGRYRSQFETGTSNGGLSARPGGDRWHWESRLFAGAYDTAPPRARPVYGSLNHRHRPTGGSPRFGSAHLRLRAATLVRATFCYPDSVFDPVHLGTAEHMSLTDLADADTAAGAVDPLDDYVEAHVHGGVRFERDVEALVLDPCYRGSDVEADARRLWDHLGVDLEWHPGFATTLDVLSQHPDYRGEHVVEAAARIAVDGAVTPRVIGDAARAGREDEQILKRVWHCTARFGSPA
ncbi:DUF3626 domain-containing protein [Kineococcus rhizosphaerae]|uniref:Uncharacterized protein DUF3626 n=1 Tax=Kineococcus rhizosphaerae TaxID=559628 RepID=A0A2T0RAJ6_9ACTN|nr:DUF3626 domain-containing protein [Kineococcus rhizosphaerae]PRY18151.1 uncharacterized protein DUF3626 [Kineococcus rhizosphaerae]